MPAADQWSDTRDAGSEPGLWVQNRTARQMPRPCTSIRDVSRHVRPASKIAVTNACTWGFAWHLRTAPALDPILAPAEEGEQTRKKGAVGSACPTIPTTRPQTQTLSTSSPKTPDGNLGASHIRVYNLSVPAQPGPCRPCQPCRPPPPTRTTQESST